ncbi:MAG: hypothetical protein DBX05_04460 [Candidatus Poseidoniales archaeon]|nr:MAG: hypothetical protein DBX05_04460 [Candidatus Poseidoniales archaeon]
MERTSPRLGLFAAAICVFLLLSLLFNSYLGVFPAIISDTIPGKFHLHYYIANLLGLEGSASAYSEAGVLTLQEHLQLILLPITIVVARRGLKPRATFEMPQVASLAEQAEAMEAGDVATVSREAEGGRMTVAVSRIMVLVMGLFLILNSVIGAFPGFIFGEFGSRLHVAYAVMSKLGMDPSGPIWSDAGFTISTQDIGVIWLLVFLIPMAFRSRGQPERRPSVPSSNLPGVGRSLNRVVNPLAQEVISSVLGTKDVPINGNKTFSMQIPAAGVMASGIEEPTFGTIESTESVVIDTPSLEEGVVAPSVAMPDFDAQPVEEPSFTFDSSTDEAILGLRSEDINVLSDDEEVGSVEDLSVESAIEPLVDNILDAVEDEPFLSAVEVTEEPIPNFVSHQETVEPKVESIGQEKLLVAEQVIRVEPTVELVSEPEKEVEEVQEEPEKPAIVPTVKGIIPVRPTNMPATAEVDPRTGRWMINGVPVGAKLGSTGIASREESVRIGMDPISESKKPSDIPSKPEISNDSSSENEMLGEVKEAEMPNVPMKDGQAVIPDLPTAPEPGSRPMAERPKPRNDEIQLPDMPKF